MNNNSTTAWKTRLYHGAHQLADLVSEFVVDLVERRNAEAPETARQRRCSRHRVPKTPPVPPDDLTRARAERVLRDNGYRGEE